MRRHFIIHTSSFFACLLAVLCLTSCLKEELKDRSEEESIYTSASSIYTNAVAALYNYIGGSEDSQGLQGTRAGVYDYNTFTTDEAIIPIRGGDWYDGGIWQRMHRHTWTTDESALYDTWTYLYKVVMLCNKSLSIIDTHKDLLTTAQYDMYYSEVRALRAIFYWYLMDMYGNVPLVTSTNTTLEDCVQSTRSEVWNFCVNELMDSSGSLYNLSSSATPGNGYGRVTDRVALFVLAKLMLNAEVYNDDDWTDNSRPDGKTILVKCFGQTMNVWQACEEYCEAIAKGAVQDYYEVELEKDFSTNFSINNTVSKENIFVIPTNRGTYAANFTNTMRSLHYNHAASYGKVGLNGPCATKKAILAFGYGTDTTDPRLDKTFFYGPVIKNNEKGQPTDTVKHDSGKPLVYYPLAVEENLTNSKRIQTAGARFKKYEIDANALSDGNRPNNNIVLFRYADALLMAAEAAVRNGEDGAEYLNQVRDRVGAPHVECTLDNILNERLLELAWEGWRRQDLVRFGQFHKAYGDERAQLSNEADAHTIVFPIPQRSIELNPNLKQNKGY